MPCQGASEPGLPHSAVAQFADVMRLRFILTPLVVLFLAIAAATAGPADTPVHPQIKLNDSTQAAQLAQRVPHSLVFNDVMGTAQVARLAEPLGPSDGDPITHYRAGDVAYWTAEESIIVFLTDGAAVPHDGFSLIGHISDDLDHLAGCNRDCPALLDVSLVPLAENEPSER